MSIFILSVQEDMFLYSTCTTDRISCEWRKSLFIKVWKTLYSYIPFLKKEAVNEVTKLQEIKSVKQSLGNSPREKQFFHTMKMAYVKKTYSIFHLSCGKKIVF